MWLQAGLKAANESRAQLSEDLEEEAARRAKLEKVLAAEEELSAQLDAQLQAATLRGDDLQGKLESTEVRVLCRMHVSLLALCLVRLLLDGSGQAPRWEGCWYVDPSLRLSRP